MTSKRKPVKKANRRCDWRTREGRVYRAILTLQLFRGTLESQYKYALEQIDCAISTLENRKVKKQNERT